MLFRAVVVGVFAMLAILQAIRTAAVAAFADDMPTAAAKVWPSHPEVLKSQAMQKVGEAAGRGQAPSLSTLELVKQLAFSGPLYAEPFLIHGALAQRAGDYERAERLLLQARQRQPRSAAARYLLGDLYVRSGQVVPGLAEMSVLARLVPGGAAILVPALAEFVQTSGSVAQLRSILSAYPELESALLSHLADNPENTDLIFALAQPRSDGDVSEWQGKLINNLVEAGDFERAYSVWVRISALKDGSGRELFNPTFRGNRYLPPFNWELTSTGGAIAEPARGGGLQVLYFGREDVVLARQLLLLPPGRYRLAGEVTGELGSGSSIAWTVTCAPGKQQVLDLALGKKASDNKVAGDFVVPAQGCAAQWLELTGRGQEFPKPAEFRIMALQLAKVSG